MQMSMDEIMARIERLSAKRRPALFKWLGERVSVGSRATILHVKVDQSLTANR